MLYLLMHYIYVYKYQNIARINEERGHEFKNGKAEEYGNS